MLPFMVLRAPSDRLRALGEGGQGHEHQARQLTCWRMHDIEVRRTHALGLAGARRAADEMAAHLGREFSLKGRWDGDTLHFDRPGIDGTLEVTANSLHLVVQLGFLLRMMKPSIEGAVHHELDALFARVHAKPARAKAKKAPAAKKKSR